jgi:hypothetical protein
LIFSNLLWIFEPEMASYSFISTIRRAFHSSIALAKTSHSSHQWLSRQMADPYVQRAKMMNYR